MERIFTSINVLFFSQTIMRLLIIILSIISLRSYGQDSSKENTNKSNQKKSYFGAHTDVVVSRLEGLEGNERKQYLEDYIKDLNFNGISAKGGISGRYASSFGLFYNRFIGRRFALHLQASYLQTGYKEALTAVGETSIGSLEEVRNFKVRLDYLHFLGGIKYYNDVGVTLTLGGFVNYNLIDKIKNEELKISSGRFGSAEIRKNEVLFFHEYYGNNRVVFVIGSVFSMGYRWKDYEVDFSFKMTSPIIVEKEDMFLHLFQVGFKYQLIQSE